MGILTLINMLEEKVQRLQSLLFQTMDLLIRHDHNVKFPLLLLCSSTFPV